MLLKQIDSDNVLELEKEETSLEQTAPVIETDVWKFSAFPKS